MTIPLSVLIVEDNEDDAELLILELERQGYELTYLQVDAPAQMLAALENQRWDVILADYSMPKFGATDALLLLQNVGLDIPFIVVSGSIGEETAVAMMKAGAHDYVLKNNLTRLGPAIERERREAQIRLERKQAQTQLRQLAYYDELTGLPNRKLFLQSIQTSLTQAEQESTQFAILSLDLDHYRNVKYGLGHQKGEKLLVEVAKRLTTIIRQTDQIARVGADEFTILLTPLDGLQHVLEKAVQLHEMLEFPIELDEGIVVSSTVSIGIVHSSIGYDDPEDLLRAADTAMHNAKLKGINQTVIFDTQMQVEAWERLQLEAELKQAIQCKKLHLNYQPIISLKTGKIIGFEALVRWRHPTRGLISPIQFIPLAEQTGLIVPLGEWVITTVRQQFKQWQEELTDNLPLSVAVNLSAVQLTHLGWMKEIEKFCEHFDQSQINLKLEITESVLMAQPDAATAVLEQVKARNIELCIDDFGTGYSSLSYLNRFPFDQIKIDRSFVKDLPVEGKNFDIVRAIIALAHTLGLDVIAEGVETQEQLQVLHSLGCEYAQGYLFSRPLEPDAVLPWMQEEKQKKQVFKPVDRRQEIR